LKPPGFNPWTYKVKNLVSNFAFSNGCQLVPLQAGARDGEVQPRDDAARRVGPPGVV
jgi:hypothetical protein